jgi:hypothetical protein
LVAVSRLHEAPTVANTESEGWRLALDFLSIEQRWLLLARSPELWRKRAGENTGQQTLRSQ